MKLLIGFAISCLLVLAGVICLTLIVDQDSNDKSFQIPTSSTRTDHVDRQVLPNGCYPALALNGTYYEVCP